MFTQGNTYSTGRPKGALNKALKESLTRYKGLSRPQSDIQP